MSDLVEELNELADAEDKSGSGHPVLHREAAAELTRLRAANKALVEAAGPLIARIDDLPTLVRQHGHACTVELVHLRALSRAVEGAKHE